MGWSKLNLGGWCTAIFVLLGCAPGGAGQPEGTGKPAAAARPASLQAAAAVIDLRTFPTLSHEELLFQSATKVGYRGISVGMSEALQFHKSKLAEAGWKTEGEQINEEYQFGEVQFSKNGFSVAVSATKDPTTGKFSVSVENQGNVDARRLPQMAAAVPGTSDFDSAGYQVAAEYEAIAKFVREEFKKLGWREYVGYGGRQERSPGAPDFVWFMQRGMHVHVMINQAEGKSDVRYQVGMKEHELPIMVEVKGDVEYMDSPGPYLLYTASAELPQVMEFYRKELTALGWTLGAEEKSDDGKIKIALQGPNKEALRLEMQGSGKVTFVMIATAEMAG